MPTYAAVVVAFMLSVLAPFQTFPAEAQPLDPCENSRTEFGCFGETDGTIDVGISGRRRGEPTAHDPHRAPATIDALAASCVDARAEAVAQGVPVPARVQAICGGVPAVTPDLVLRAFRELPLYHGGIRTDPRGWTLVNLETFLWCGDGAGRSCPVLGESEQTVTLLGRQVRVRPRILSYTWQFGDGTEQTTAGAAGRVGHVYRRPVQARVQVTLTWTAEFAVAGQAFQPIPGTTTTTSPPLVLPVRQARPVLVGGG